ncbi:MAG: prolyl aminopeptidase [Methylococcaceae bacterium]|nr:prolyl aminopeptidase [Methylococcaceae bacterium]MCI0733012.1 prolyl aminopeptidase [Methylococcaceae bacterium]
MKNLFPPLEPYACHRLEVDAVHRIYVEECGNRLGLPVVFLHGGPASGCKPDHRRFFDPRKYRIILFDQRAAGRSTPKGEISKNTTQDLVQDMERIREKLGIDRWLVYGGSWGATLGLLYTQSHLDRVCGLVLRGVFLARRADLEWFLVNGLNRIYPEQWQRLCQCVPENERNDLISAFQRRLNGRDELAKRRVAREWDAWGRLVSLGVGFHSPESEMAASDPVAQVRVEIHYAANAYFIAENQVVEGCRKIKNIPVILLHGRYDLVCPVEAAFNLHQALPGSILEVLPNSGHVARGEEMIDGLVRATNAMLDRVKR